MSTRRGLNVTREQDFPAWYQAVVREADLAEVSPVRGCMIIKPWGYGIWDLIQAELDRGIKALGNDNCYFPLFIPLSVLAKEAEHVEGFAKEMAVVTHPTHEAVTVISGDFNIGMGDKLDEAKAEKLTAGSFVDLPANMNHFAFA